MLEAEFFHRKLASYFLFFYLFITFFMLDPGPDQDQEPEAECITVPVPLRQKSCGSCGSTTLFSSLQLRVYVQ
jgi:hypothetical protein